MKVFSKALFACYLQVLLWLILFKLSFDLSPVLAYRTRSVNWIPFALSSFTISREVLYNCVAFIPFGLLLSVNFKRTGFWRKLAAVFAFSLAAEAAQFVFAIGITDVTDLITNTLGGLLGLTLYKVSNRFMSGEKLDRLIVLAGMILLGLSVFLRVLFFDVTYYSAPPL